MLRSTALIVSVFLAVPALSKELPTFFKGVRPLGMGGAFTAVANDENALFYNPAGLDRVERWRTGPLNPQAEVGEGGYAFARDAQGTDFNDTGEVTELLRDNVGESEHYRAALFPNFVTKHFGFGILAQLNATFQPNNVAWPETDVFGFQTVSGHAGLGFGFFDGVLRVGAGAKYVQAYRLNEIYDASDITSNDFQSQVEDDLKNGAGFGIDTGAMVVLPVFLDPTFAAVIQNVGDTGLGEAGELPQQLNLGFSVKHAFPWFTLIGAADWVDVTTQIGEDNDTYKRLHLGLEAAYGRILSVRTGLYQGYLSLGTAIDFRALRVDYATYAEEIGSSAGDRGDRRHVLVATFGW
jgi:hypothetical protein